MKNSTAAITGALTTALIGGLAYAGKKIYDKYHNHDTVFGDDPADWESDPYVDGDEEIDKDEEFFKKVMPEYYEDEEDDDGLEPRMVDDPFDHPSPDDPLVKECLEYEEKEEEEEEKEETTENNQ